VSRDDAPPTFLFQQGQRVKWSGFPLIPFTITGHHWEERDILGPVVQYRLAFPVTDAGMPGLVYEPDLEPWRAPEE
jgi:hypothetical protein